MSKFKIEMDSVARIMFDAWLSRFAQAQTAATSAEASAESSFAQQLVYALDQSLQGLSAPTSLLGSFPDGSQFAAFDPAMGSAQPGGGAAPAGRQDYAALARRTAMEYGVNPALVESVIGVESGYDPNAVSHAGAEGLMQLMPATAAELGVSNPMNPTQNISGGVRYLKQMLDRYDGNVPLALAAYNAGPGAVDRAGGIPDYTETRAYVAKVIRNWQQMSV